MGLENLIHRIDRVFYPLWANRVTGLGIALYATGHYVAATSQPHTTARFIGAVLYGSAPFFVGFTNFGASTLRHYRRARKHIAKNNGKLDPRYARAVIEQSENHAFVGYCQQQGLYLAARDTGNLAPFTVAKQAYSQNIIPHF